MHLIDRVIEQDQFVWVLGSICQLNRIPFDPQLLLQQFAPPHHLANLIKAAQALGFKTGQQRIKISQLAKQPLPCLAILHVDQSEVSSAAVASNSERIEPSFIEANAPTEVDPQVTSTIRLALIVKADGDKVLYFEPGNQQPTVIPVADFESRFTGEVLLFKPEAKAVVDDEEPGSVSGAGQSSNQHAHEFGFRWFVPELLKHKRLWRDVLLASLAIQLIALATPLFTQVIIDKVVVHHTINRAIVKCCV